MRWVWFAVAALLAVAGAVQFNDPDSFLWVLVYWGGAGVCALWGVRERLSVKTRVGVLVVAFGLEVGSVLWGVLLIHDVLAVGRLDLNSEVQREFGGLLIVIASMSALINQARLSRRVARGGAKAALRKG
ncbi:MAG: transmembrane 220 family protein [Phycisphaerales bacterium JB040]